MSVEACRHDGERYTEDRPPHVGEFCADCTAWIRWVPKVELGIEPRSVSSRPGVKPRTRALVLDRFGHACMSCGRRPPEVLLHLDHILPVELAKEHGVYDDLIECDINLAPFCEECNLGKGDQVFTVRTVALMYRCLVVASKR